MKKTTCFIGIIFMAIMLTTFVSCDNNIRITVTEEEWNNNMNAMNCEYYFEHSHELLGTAKWNIKNDVNGFSQYNIIGDHTIFYVKKNDRWYRVNKNNDNNEYVGTLINEHYQGTTNIKNNISSNISLECDYSQFVFDKEIGGYVYIQEINHGTKSVYVFFENGELVRVEARIVDNTSTYYETWIFVFKNINKTVVDIPEFTIKQKK